MKRLTSSGALVTLESSMPATENSDIRFVADAMLGRLARWLRALGYDTLYDASIDDNELASVARDQARTLLTRDVELARRRGLSVLLVADDKVSRQLRQVVRDLELTTRAAFTRCVECNAELTDISLEDARDRVPPYVYRTQTRFRACPVCGKVYWRGTHWDHMRQILDAVQKEGEGG